MGRLPRYGKEYHQEQEDGTVMKKGAWSAEEDEKLVAFITTNKGHGSWRTLPRLAGLERCGKSCRLRWTNYLRPNIKRGNFSADEELVILRLHALLGNKWSAIASHLPGRTDNEVKNHWNTYLKKRLTRMGLDPATHLPFNILQAARSLHGDPSASIRSNVDWQKAFMLHALKVNSGMACHLLQWELVRLEAEARQQQLASSQNCPSAWLQSLRQMQTPASEVDSLFMAANVQTHPVNEHHVLSPTQVQSFQISNDDYLLNTSFSPCQSNGMSSSVSALQNFQASPLSNEESEQLPEDRILNSANGGSTGNHDTCNSSDSLSSHLLPSQFDVPDDLISLDPSSDKRYNPVHILDPHESSLLSLDDHTTGQQDSYWNRMLKFLDQVTMENL